MSKFIDSDISNFTQVLTYIMLLGALTFAPLYIYLSDDVGAAAGQVWELFKQLLLMAVGYWFGNAKSPPH